MTHLKDHFTEMWQKVKADYQTGKVCSERHLEAVIYHHLISDENFRNEFAISIEPVITGDGTCLTDLKLSGTIPDMIITNKDEKEITAIVEIKYVPHNFIPFQKDIGNLAKFWKLRKIDDHCIYLDLMPGTGRWNTENKYKVSNNLYLIYCAIGNRESYGFTNTETMWSKAYTTLEENPNYLMFTGSIHRDGEPDFNPKSNS